MLAGKLTLHEIDDAEAFCIAIVQRSGLELTYYSREDLTSYLIEECWILSTRYDGSQGSSFAAWAKLTLTRRVIDWQRSRNGRTRWQFAGRTYDRVIPALVPLEHRPEQADTSGAMDTAASGVQAVLGLERARGRSGAGDTNGNSQGTSAATEGRAA